MRSTGDLYASAMEVKSVRNAMQLAKKKIGNAKLYTQDFLGMIVFLAMLPIGFLFVVTFQLSFWHQPFSEGWLFRVVPLFFLGLNVYLNAFRMVSVGPNGNMSDLPSIMKPGFKFCHNCQLNAPPRSFHCPVCDVCVYRRDHHCSFTSCCVGHYNQRYFIAAIANLWVINLVCAIWNWSALWIALPSSFGLIDYWKITFPHFALILGYLSVFQALMIVVFMSSITALAFVTYQIVAQLYCFWRGQTRVEFLMDVHAYDLGFWENVRQALGSRWPLIFVSPLIPSPLQSDGISFRAREHTLLSKNMKSL